MRKLIHLISLVTVSIFVSCDKISNPIVPKTSVIGSNFETNSNASIANSKKVLLEDYTGQRCTNCPPAASIIKNSLIPTYLDNLIVIAVHQGNTYARPYGKFVNDFRTTAGEEWGELAAGTKIGGWPMGLVNRKNYNSAGVQLAPTNWGSTITTALDDPFVIKLDLKTEYDPTVRALNVNVKATFNTPYSNAIKLSAVYIEEGIIGLQDTKTGEVEDYEFEHMLRGDINGSWGIDLTTKAALAKDTVRWVKTGFPLPKEAMGPQKSGLAINDKNVSVIVFAYDALTREVLQAEKVKIRPSPSGSTITN